MKTKISLLISLIALICVSCQEEGLKLYSGGHFIQFAKENTDSIRLSFLSSPASENSSTGTKSIVTPVIMEIVGLASDRDLTYALTIDTARTTASAEQYDLPEKTVIRAGHYQDTCYVRLINTPDLDTKKVRLVLKLKPTQDLALGEVEKSENIIWFTNSVERPDWWTTDVEELYLGTYSDKKYKLFMEVTGESDLTGATESALRSYAIQFKQYLSEHPTLDEDGQYMSVPVL